MITLQEFVTETLVQISEGIEQAQIQLHGRAVVNPPLVRRHVKMEDRSTHHVETPRNHVIEFEVQVVTASVEQAKGEAKAKLYVFSGSAGGEKRSEAQQVNRVSFSIPIVFP